MKLEVMTDRPTNRHTDGRIRLGLWDNFSAKKIWWKKIIKPGKNCSQFPNFQSRRNERISARFPLNVLQLFFGFPPDVHRILWLKKQGVPEVGIYKRKQASKKTRKHALDQESDQDKREKKKENTLSTKKAIKKNRKKKGNTPSTKKATKEKKKNSFFSSERVFLFFVNPFFLL